MNNYKVSWYIHHPYQVGETVVRTNGFISAQEQVKSMYGPNCQITGCVMVV